MEKTFDTGELSLCYYEGGSGAPLVLLHGLTSNKAGWKPLLPALEANYHVYALDFRGHGKSDRAPDNQYHLADYARDVIAFLKHLDAPVVLMGISLGAMVAITTASKYPDGVGTLILLEPALFTHDNSVQPAPERTQWLSLVVTAMQGDPSYDTIVARLRAVMPDVPDEQITGTATYISGVAPGAPETMLRGEIWHGVDLPQALRQISCPTLLIHGDWDRGGAVRPQDVEFFRKNVPSGQVVRIPDADHGLMMWEQPELLLQPITAFLSTV